MKLSAIGITPQKEKQFNGKGIFSVEDMVRYLPRKYNDFSRETGSCRRTKSPALL